MNVAVIGNGGFGTAMSVVATRSGCHRVRMWGNDPDYTQELAATRENARYLPGVSLPLSVDVSVDPELVLEGAEVVLFAVPTQHLRDVAVRLRDHISERTPLVSLAKGLEQKSGKRPTEILRDVFPDVTTPVLALGGPCHAEEAARGVPATVVLAGEDPELVARLQHGLSCDSFRIYGNPDVLGVELCGALKNVIALAAGIAEGLGLGDNTKAAILSRGLIEMARYGEVYGAQRETFFGLAGVGDLSVTVFSQHGRNRAFGVRIGRGESLESVLVSTRKVAEGVWTAREVRERASQLGIEMPIAEAVCAVLFEEQDALNTARDLMERDMKHELGSRGR